MRVWRSAATALAAARASSASWHLAAWVAREFLGLEDVGFLVFVLLGERFELGDAGGDLVGLRGGLLAGHDLGVALAAQVRGLLDEAHALTGGEFAGALGQFGGLAVEVLCFAERRRRPGCGVR